MVTTGEIIRNMQFSSENLQRIAFFQGKFMKILLQELHADLSQRPQYATPDALLAIYPGVLLALLKLVHKRPSELVETNVYVCIT